MVAPYGAAAHSSEKPTLKYVVETLPLVAAADHSYPKVSDMVGAACLVPVPQFSHE